jgi:hypothetical protein
MPSTVVHTINYDPGTETLRITFVSGIIYEYKNVPETIYIQLKTSRSKGVFLNTNIKGKYDFEKVTQDPPPASASGG